MGWERRVRAHEYNEVMRNQQAIEIGRGSTSTPHWGWHKHPVPAHQCRTKWHKHSGWHKHSESLRLPFSGQEGRTSDLTHRISKPTGQEQGRASEDARHLVERPNSHKYSLTQPLITGALKCRVYDISQTTITNHKSQQIEHSTQGGRNRSWLVSANNERMQGKTHHHQLTSVR